jgi:hypothetical protein
MLQSLVPWCAEASRRIPLKIRPSACSTKERVEGSGRYERGRERDIDRVLTKVKKKIRNIEGV